MRISKTFFSPILFLPLALVTPFIYMGSYGVTFFEILTVLVFLMFILESEKEPIFLPKLLRFYLFLFFIGWAGALINATVNWDINVGVAELKFFYYLLLAIAGYNIGYRQAVSMDKVVTHPFFRVILTGLVLFIFIYIFLSYTQRFSILRFFYPPQEEIHRLYNDRFPGLGVNANLYAFMIYICFLFCIDGFCRKKGSPYMILGLFLGMLCCGSKSVVFLSIISSFVLLLGRYPLKRINYLKRVLSVFCGVMLCLGAAALFLNNTKLGGELLVKISALERMGKALDYAKVNDDRDGVVEGRFTLWGMGMERVQLAPILGIIPDRYRRSDSASERLYFFTPHNEFIAFWMFYGLFGLIAHVFLMVSLIVKNLGHREMLVWSILYSTCMMFMLFDAAFTAPRFQALFFMLVGMNIHALRKLKRDKFLHHANSAQAYQGTVALN